MYINGNGNELSLTFKDVRKIYEVKNGTSLFLLNKYQDPVGFVFIVT